jgi:hypothetical protein
MNMFRQLPSGCAEPSTSSSYLTSLSNAPAGDPMYVFTMPHILKRKGCRSPMVQYHFFGMMSPGLNRKKLCSN